MNIWGKILIGAGAVTGIGLLIKMARTGSEIETITTGKIHKLDLSGLTIRVDAKVKNPTGTSLTIKQPFVKLVYKDSTIGTSQVVDKDIPIPAHGEPDPPIAPIMIHVPILGIFSIGAELLKAASTGIKVKAITTTTINGKIPYKKEQDITLKK